MLRNARRLVTLPFKLESRQKTSNLFRTLRRRNKRTPTKAVGLETPSPTQRKPTPRPTRQQPPSPTTRRTPPTPAMLHPSLYRDGEMDGADGAGAHCRASEAAGRPDAGAAADAAARRGAVGGGTRAGAGAGAAAGVDASGAVEGGRLGAGSAGGGAGVVFARGRWWRRGRRRPAGRSRWPAIWSGSIRRGGRGRRWRGR